jgi:hypothetical protein
MTPKAHSSRKKMRQFLLILFDFTTLMLSAQLWQRRPCPEKIVKIGMAMESFVLMLSACKQKSSIELPADTKRAVSQRRTQRRHT